MFDDYTKLVLLDYERKRAANALSIALIYPSPAKLKKECLAVCQYRYERKKDERALQEFFGNGYDKASVLREISRCDRDKFKPLINFLRKETTKTDEKNIELLAWLIDFEDRPFELSKKYPDQPAIGNDTADDIAEMQQSATQVEKAHGEKPTATQKKPQVAASLPLAVSRRMFNFYTIAAIIGVIIVGFVGVFIYQDRQSPGRINRMKSNTNNQEACMYWAEDHYQQISCSQKVYGALVVALDSVKLNHFKKITRPDTITKADIGNIWYAKIKGRVEFYTAEGNHPIELNRPLKPVTAYIINKYVLSSPK